MTKIDIVSGFLGAGKTTLIKKLIAEAYQGEQLVLIENEFGEIGIDGGFLKDAGINITEMNSGCICCSLVGDFGEALKKVAAEYHPSRIIIEPSGVGKLSDVIKAVEDVKPELEDVVLNSFVAVVDAGKSKMYMKNFGEFFNNQVEYAGTIILSRTQDMKQEKLEECVKQLREHNASATIITTPWDEIKGEQILAAMEKNNTLEKELLEEEHHHHHHEEEEHECCHHHDHEGEEHECCHDHEGDEHHHHHHHEGEEHECCHDHEEGEHHHGEHHHHHHADEVFSSWGVETPHKFTREELTAILAELSESDRHGMILRSKGIVPAVTGEWLHFDMTPGEYEIREGAADITGRICVIGSKLKEDEIAALFLVK